MGNCMGRHLGSDSNRCLSNVYCCCGQIPIMGMIRYSTNCMGPINPEWIKKNGDAWTSGRIDVYGDGYESELGLPPMDWKDWDRFSQWLNKFKSVEPMNLEQLVNLFEQSNSKILWFRKPKWEE